MSAVVDNRFVGRLATTVLVLVAVVAAVLVALTAAGWRLQVVESGSMAPRYPVGALLMVQPVDPGDVGPGTPIVYEDPRGRQVTHRVVSVTDGPDGRAFETRGDANAASDPTLVPASAVVGQVRWSLPALGTPAAWLGARVAAVLFVAVPAALLIVTEAAAWRRRRLTTRAGC